MFATASGNVRRNRLSDFTNVMANGKIAMKLDEGDRLVRVRTCTEDDDVLLATRQRHVHPLSRSPTCASSAAAPRPACAACA
jgi:DNA gyrase/topoisomerase IV subunit A